MFICNMNFDQVLVWKKKKMKRKGILGTRVGDLTMNWILEVIIQSLSS